MPGDDESIDDDASDIGWNSEDDTIFYKKVNKDADEYDESDDENAEGGVLLTDILLNDNTVPKKISSAYAPEIDNDDTDDEEDINDEYHDDLLNAIEKFSKSATKAPKESKTSANGSVSLESLLGALDDTKGFIDMKQKLTDLNQSSNAPRPIEKVISDRYERSLTYSAAKENIDKWSETVTVNRNVKCLDLAQDKRQLANYQNLVKSFEPSNDLEKEVEMVLISSGLDEKNRTQLEEDELGERYGSVEEIQQKQNELAKVKALMFYEQMKRHRINKIKSKAYHRIRKKQRTRKSQSELEEIAEFDEEVAEALKEKETVKRVKERMDLKHSSTGRWAQMAAKHSQHDKSLRNAYHEAVELGHELTKRMHSDPSGNENDEGNSEEEGDAFDELQGSNSNIAASSAKQIRAVLDESPADILSGLSSTSKYSRLLDMDFMRKAAERQSQQAREDAELLLREIRDMERDADDADESLDTGEKATESGREKQWQPVSEAERTAIAGRMGVGMSLQSDVRQQLSGLRVQGNITVSGSDGAKNWTEAFVAEESGDREAASNPWLSLPRQDLSSKIRGGGGKKAGKKNGQSKGVPLVSIEETMTNSEEIAATSTDQKKRSMNNTTKNHSSENISEKSNKKRKAKHYLELSGADGSTEKPSIDNSVRKSLLPDKSQTELVRLAFSGDENMAGPDYEADFQASKRQAVDDELGVSKSQEQILAQDKKGWGQWAGPGAKGISKGKKLKQELKLQQLGLELQDKRKKRADSQKKLLNVIISERRIGTQAKYKVEKVPHPFSSREEYDRSLQMPIGAEWNASHIVAKNIIPEIKTRAGRIIEPIRLTVTSKKEVNGVRGTSSKSNEKHSRRALGAKKSRNSTGVI